MYLLTVFVLGGVVIFAAGSGLAAAASGCGGGEEG